MFLPDGALMRAGLLRLLAGSAAFCLVGAAWAGQGGILELSSDPYGTDPTVSIEADPREYFATLQSARAAFAGGNCAEAARLFEKLTGWFADDGDNWLLLGHCRSALGQWRKAIGAYEKALQYGAFPFDLTDDVNPNDTMVKIARAYAQLGEADASVEWLERALKARHDDRFQWPSDDGLAPLQSDARFAGLAGLYADEPASREEGWRRDLEFLRAEMERIHPDMTHLHAQSEFGAAFTSLAEKIPDYDDSRMSAEFVRLLGLLGNGHNLLLPFASDHGGLPQTPFRFYAFADGVYIMHADEGFEEWVGARIDRFAKTPTAKALEMLEPFVARDNNTQLRFLGLMWLTTPHVLEAAGVIEDADNLTLHVTMPDGRRRRISDIPLRDFALETAGLKTSDETASQALYLSNFDETLWFRSLPEAAALYLQLTDVQPCCDMTIAEFATRAQAEADRTNARALIIDLRNNAGGNSYLAMGIVRLAAYFEVSRGDGSVFVIMGRNSLSAAHTLIVDIDRLTNAIFVGEPDGSSANAFAENGWFRLPYSGLFGFISSQLQQYSWPEDHRIWIAPHVPVSLTSKDYFAGRDPALEAILDIIDGRSD